MAVGFRDYYETLGVDRGASEKDIRSAYRKLARQYHPDVNKDPGAEDRFKEVSEAYDVLTDPEKRGRYDRLGANWKAGQDVSGAPGWEDVFRGGATGAGGGGRRARRSSGGAGFGDGVRVEFGGGEDFSDFFGSMFGGGGASSRGGGIFDSFTRGGGEQEAVLDLSLEEAAQGGRRTLSLDGREFEIDLPPGVRDGQRLRVSGGGDDGDLILRIRLRRHPRLRLRGDDLYFDLPVTPWEAALGAEISVPTLTGSGRLRVPPGSSSGRRLRLRGQGMPRADGTSGDLYAVVTIKVPKRLTKRERELFEQLQQTSKFNPREERS
jgi:curved DNA-binding protein